MQSFFEVDLLLQVRGITPGRIAALLAGLVGLISVGIGWWALVRSARHINSGRIMAMVALVVGLTGMLLSGLHLARATGDFGTGSGRAGTIVGLVVGAIGMVLGGRALARSRRVAKGQQEGNG